VGTHRLSPVDSIGGPMSAAWCAVGKNAMNELARQVCQDSKGKTRAKSFADFEWAVAMVFIWAAACGLLFFLLTLLI